MSCAYDTVLTLVRVYLNFTLSAIEEVGESVWWALVSELVCSRGTLIFPFWVWIIIWDFMNIDHAALNIDVLESLLPCMKDLGPGLWAFESSPHSPTDHLSIR